MKSVSKIDKIDDESVAIDSSNHVRELIAQLEQTFTQNDDRVEKAFVEISLSAVRSFITHISEASNLPLIKRLDILRNVQSYAAEREQIITPNVPDKASRLWKNRGTENRKMSPCDFLIKNYNSYGINLTQADIRQLDPQLYSALHNWKTRFGWPDEFFLPTKKEFQDIKLQSLSIADKSELRRITDAIRHRKYRRKLQS